MNLRTYVSPLDW